MFGVECVKHTQSIDLIVNLEEWDKDANYDRLGLEDQYTEILGNKIVSHSIPIRPGTKYCGYRRGRSCQPQTEEDGIQCGSGIGITV